MSSQTLLRLLRSQAPQIRSFTQTSPFLAARPKKPSIPSPRAPPKHAPKVSPAQTKAPTLAPRTPAPVRAPIPAPAPRDATFSNATLPPSRTAETYASGLLGDAESLLLYKAPGHLGLFGLSTISGSALFYWAAYITNGVLVSGTMPWYGNLVVIAGCVVTSAMASACMMTAFNMVKTISVARADDNQAVLRVKATRFLPFIKPRVIDIVPGQIMIDMDVTMDETTARKWYGVPLQNARAWTEGKIPNPDEPQGNLIQRFNHHLLNAWPATKSHVKKMFNREGLAYARIGSHNYKLDLERCEILENGSVLMKMSKEGYVRTSAVGMLMRGMFGK